MVWMLLLALAQAQDQPGDEEPRPAVDRDVDPSMAWPGAGCAAIGDVEGTGRLGDDLCGSVRVSVASRPVTQGEAIHVGGRMRAVPTLAWRGERGELVLGVPVVSQWGATVGASDGIGFGDPLLGVRVRVSDTDTARLALALDLRAPFGTDDVWMGEAGTRIRPGLMVELGSGAHVGVAQAGLTVRTSFLPTPFSDAPWGSMALAWRADWSDALRTQLAVHGRSVFGTTDGVRGGPVELRATAQIRVGSSLVELGGGTALVRGLGSSRARLLIGFSTWRGPSDNRDRYPEVLAARDRGPLGSTAGRCSVDDPQDACLPEDPTPLGQSANPAEPDPSTEPRDDSDAGTEAEGDPPGPEPDPQVSVPSIVLETLRFEVGTDVLLSESEPVLRALVTDLLSQPKVGPILLEGHASQEGAFNENYRLSLRRADAVYRRLVDAGVSPSRLVLRPLGEVDDDAIPDLAARRRVEVRLVLDPLFVDDVVIHPFTGEEVAP